MTALKVLVIGLHYEPEPSGNAPYTTGLARGLAARGHDVRVVAGTPHYPSWSVYPGYGHWTALSKEGGVRVTRLRHFVPSSPTAAKRVAMEISFGARTAMRSMSSIDAAICVSPALLSTALAIARLRAMRRRPAIGLWVQDLYSRGLVETGVSAGGVARVAQTFEGSVARAADGVAAIHQRFAKQLTNELRVPADRVRVIRNWSHLPPVQRMERSEARRRLGWGSDEAIALHAGNMGAKQGLENVVEAAREADRKRVNMRFVLVGDGNQRARLEQLGRGVERLTFVNSLEQSDFTAALAAADVLLVNEKPGVTEMSVPSKLTSYYTSGNPVVAATEKGSVTSHEIAVAGSGVRVDPGRPDALLEEVLQLAHDTERAQTLGQAGLRFREEVLSEAAAIDSFENWLHELVNRRNRESGK